MNELYAKLEETEYRHHHLANLLLRQSSKPHLAKSPPLQTELKTPFGEIPPCKQSSRPQRNLLLQTELKTADTNRHVLPPFATVVGTTVASCQSEPHLLLCRLPKEKNN
nr:hypothetical protein Itr_chr08CG11240 [Ipomoea trifida]